jgi:4-hydroxy-tetrahydrodipicolinate synthase
MPQIVGIKEGEQNQLHDTVRLAGSSMSVLTARDSYLLPSMAVGAAGVVSFAANVEPELHVALYDAMRAGNLEVARRLHEAGAELVAALVARSYPVLIKEAMRMKGLRVGPARRVARGLADAERERLQEAFAMVARVV